MDSKMSGPAQGQATTSGVADVIDAANAVRGRARGIRRHSDVFLYELLADCMALAERPPAELEALRQEYGLSARTETGKRFYIERNSKPEQIVCRYVFREADHRANVNRYALALTEAAKRQIKSDGLVEWLNENGGVNALFLARPVEAEFVQTKTLRLDRPITARKSYPVHLTLLRQLDGAFKVLEVRHD